MKKPSELNTTLRSISLISLGLITAMTSACNVVVPEWNSANIFGRITSGAYDPQEPYAVNLLACKAELFPNILFPTENATIPAATLGTLNSTFPGWTFNTAATQLSDDSIEIQTYDVLGTSTRVGVEIHARYVPHAGDPTTDLHWIQVLSTNHGLKGAGHGSAATYVDVASTSTTPYYDDGYAGNSVDIYDRPSRIDAAQDHTWEATTFLVTGPDIGDPAGTITVQVPGFTWGWKNTCEGTDGFIGYYYFVEAAERIDLPEALEPGGRLQLRSENASSMVLGKEKTTAAVNVLSRSIDFSIDKEVDAGGLSALQNATGEISFDAFTFGEKEMPALTADISRGSGYLHWESGEASLEFVVSLALPDGKTEDMVFTGTGQYDRNANTFMINSDMKGVSETFLKSNVPEDTKKKEEK